ncbi:MAG: deoxyguanosinetriphosphate triphosphohydrolase [Trueperaceae bacterium]
MLFTKERLEQNERASLAPYASLAKFSRGRIYLEEESLYRTAYQKDRDRVIHTSAFRRLEYKTQVFVNYEGDYYRTRLTHTLEVVQVSKSIARALGLNEDLAETIALAHDLGHPPFGHAGERTLNRLSKDIGGFDHNQQSLRVVTELEHRYDEFPGLNLTWEVLEGIMKHNANYIVPDTTWQKTPQASLEAQVVNLADELAYNAHDLDDGLRSGHLTPKQIREVPVIGELMATLQLTTTDFAQHERHRLIRELLGLMIVDTIRETHARLEVQNIQNIDDVRQAKQKFASTSGQLSEQLRALKQFLFEHLYRHYRLVRMITKADAMLERIFLAYQTSPAMLPTNIQACIPKYGLVRALTDYLADMTDRFVSEEYQRLFDPQALT